MATNTRKTPERGEGGKFLAKSEKFEFPLEAMALLLDEVRRCNVMGSKVNPLLSKCPREVWIGHDLWRVSTREPADGSANFIALVQEEYALEFQRANDRMTQTKAQLGQVLKSLDHKQSFIDNEKKRGAPTELVSATEQETFSLTAEAGRLQNEIERLKEDMSLRQVRSWTFPTNLSTWTIELRRSL